MKPFDWDDEFKDIFDNNEIIFLHVPKYILDKNFELDESELKELDELAVLMRNPNENFEKFRKIASFKRSFEDTFRY